jgi:hypothetical protein
MSVVGGVPIETLADAPQDERDRVMTLLFALLLRELFEFRLVQTDPNFANYRFDTDTRQLILLDFGATRPYKASMANEFRRLMKGAMAGDRDQMNTAALAIGYYDTTTRTATARPCWTWASWRWSPSPTTAPTTSAPPTCWPACAHAASNWAWTAISGNCRRPTPCCCNASSAACICWRSG